MNVDASQLASNVTNEVIYVNIQHRKSPNIDGKYPAVAVSAGNAIMPAPTAVPANKSDAPSMFPSSLFSLFVVM